MKKPFLVGILFFIAVCNSYGQYFTNQNKFWAFGNHGGVNFATGVPVAVSTNISILEGSAAVCDPGGSLLFYTDGKIVWDRTGAVMPSGSSIVPYSTSDAAQGAQIIPVIGNPNLYYIFSGDVYITGRLSHSLIDMTLHGGYGDVVTAESGILMGSNYAEKMTAIAGNDCNIWVLTHRRDSAVFWVYSVSTAGISAPVVSAVGSASTQNAGVMKVSPNRQKVATQNCEGAYGTELFDFNPSTGVVSNCQVLDAVGNNYGGEFSADNSKFYSSTLYGTQVDQYDVTLPTTAAIVASKTNIGTVSGAGDMKLAVDSKIYIVKYPAAFLDCIPNPNLSGLACGYVANAVPLASGTTGELGLPNIIISVTPADTTYSRQDTVACIPPGDSIVIHGYDTLIGSSYIWSDGTTTTLTKSVFGPGKYWCKIYNGCSLIIDTINVGGDTVVAHTDTSICNPGDFSFVTLTAPTGLNYLWFNGDTLSTLVINTPGTYWVAFQAGCGITIDTFNVTYNTFPYAIGGPDTICPGDTVVFTESTAGGRWYSTDPAVTAIDSLTGKVIAVGPGTATIIFTAPSGCYTAKTVTINSGPCDTWVNDKIQRYKRLVEVFPNPAYGELNIKSDIKEFNAFTITNSIGQVFMRQDLKADLTTVDVRSLAAGLYYVTLTGDNGSVVKKFVKQ